MGKGGEQFNMETPPAKGRRAAAFKEFNAKFAPKLEEALKKVQADWVLSSKLTNPMFDEAKAKLEAGYVVGGDNERVHLAFQDDVMKAIEAQRETLEAKAKKLSPGNSKLETEFVPRVLQEALGRATEAELNLIRPYTSVPYNPNYWGSYRHWANGNRPGWTGRVHGRMPVLVGTIGACVVTAFLFYGIKGTWVKPLPKTLSAEWEAASEERRVREGVYDIERHEIGKPVKYTKSQSSDSDDFVPFPQFDSDDINSKEYVFADLYREHPPFPQMVEIAKRSNDRAEFDENVLKWWKSSSGRDTVENE